MKEYVIDQETLQAAIDIIAGAIHPNITHIVVHQNIQKLTSLKEVEKEEENGNTE